MKDRALAASGGMAVLIYLTAWGLVPTSAPDSGSTGAQIVHFAGVHRSQLLLSDLLLALAVSLLMVFSAGLYRVVRRAEGEDGWLAMASLASVVLGSATFYVGITMFMTVAYRPATDPALARALWDAGWLAYNVTGFAFAAWMAIVAALALRDRALPSWTAPIGFVVAAITLVGPLAVKSGTGPFSPQGWFAVVVGLSFAVWILALCGAVWRGATTAVA